MKVRITEQPATETEQRLILTALIKMVERFFQEHPELDEAIRNGNLKGEPNEHE